jgi:hypothetical protein
MFFVEADTASDCVTASNCSDSSSEESDGEEHFEVKLAASTSLSISNMIQPCSTASTIIRSQQPPHPQPSTKDQQVQVDVDANRTLVALKMENIFLKRRHQGRDSPTLLQNFYICHVFSKPPFNC